MNHVFKNVLSAVAAAILLAGIPSQAAVIPPPVNYFSEVTALTANGSGIWVGTDLHMSFDRNNSSPTAFGSRIDLNAEGMSFSDEANLRDAIDTLSRMPPGAGGSMVNAPAGSTHAEGSVANKTSRSSHSDQVPEPVLLALFALGLVGVSTGIRRYIA